MVMSYSCMARPSRGMIGGIYRQEQGHHVAVEGRRNTVEKNIDNHHNIPIATTKIDMIIILEQLSFYKKIYM
ncbi:hypothetical protein ERO13_A04G072966v2 [Gossypium hirsutum]|nr:hypothetical protein ERO13_A04G072966v2 [Gossypium hirsutum]